MAAAQAQQMAMQQMWANANPSMMQFNLQPSGRKQRELYVGNLCVGVVTGDMLKEFFSSILTQCEGYQPAMGPPVCVVQLSGEGKFAFVEFRDELIAVTALQLDKVELAGRPLNVGRPAGYQPAPGIPLPPLPLPPGVVAGLPSAPADPSAAAAVAALVGGTLSGPLAGGMPGGGAPPAVPGVPGVPGLATLPGPTVQAVEQAGRKQRELYVGNLPVGLITQQQLKDLSTPLLGMEGVADEATGGPIVNKVDISADGKFAFVEFRDEQLATVALTLFDKMEVCGRNLNVGRPRGFVEPGTLPLPGMIPGMMPGMPPVATPTAGSNGASPPGVPPPPPPPPPTTCLKLDGMLTDEMLDNDDSTPRFWRTSRASVRAAVGPSRPL